MSSDKHLLVPIHIDALAVGDNVLFDWASLAPDFSRLRTEYRIGADLRFPFQAGKKMAGKNVPKGIHLLFRLPPMLTHGSGEDTKFPLAPNRWLVQRYYTGKNPRLTRAWMVYSDRESKDPNAVVLPVFRHGSDKGKYDAPLWLRPTGVTVPIVDENNKVQNDFRENDTPAAIAITAVTAGDAGFAAHYPACRGILGFFDDLKGVPDQTRLSYLVTGWYSGKGDDPWNQFVNDPNNPLPQNEADRREAVRNWLAEHRCDEKQEFADIQNLPSGILCHGLVRNVVWRKAGYESSAVPAPFKDFFDQNDPEKHWVDLGNNSSEALAARVSQVRGDAGGDFALFEDIVAAFLTGLLSQGPGVCEMDAEMHRQGFAGVRGGEAWILEPEQTAPKDGEARAPSGPLSRDLQEKLDELNRWQAERDQFTRRFSDYRWELYALWHRWTRALKEGEDDEELAAGLEALKSFVADYPNLPQRADAERSLANAKAALEKAISAEKTKYSLIARPADPFYAPGDPVITITGPAMEALGTDPRTLTARCRVTGEELLKFTYKEKYVGRPREFEATQDWLKTQVSEAYLDAIPAWCQRLLSEALLRDEMRKFESEEDEGNKRYEEVQAAPGNVLPSDTSDFTWKHNPWVPLYLYWQIKWTADYERPDGAIVSQWKLEDAAGAASKYQKADLAAVAPDEAPVKSGRPSSYFGYTLLGRPLLDQRLSLAENAGGSGAFAASLLKQIKELFPVARRSRMTSQALGGFHDALIMRRIGDQLPPFSYQRFSEEAGHPLYLDRIAEVLGSDQAFDSSPAQSGPFLPLRAGRFEFEELRVVDAFGQTFELLGPRSRQISVCVSRRLAAGTVAGKDLASVRFRFRPRFCRPMRLAFCGTSARNPAPIAPPFSPICGWIVANHFEKSLILYAANGRPVGALQQKFGLQPGPHLFYWVPVPGLNGASPEIEEIPNGYLRGFAKFILNLTADQGRAFGQLIDQAVSATEQRVPENGSPVSVLAGRPLALVRAELRLETAGLPALDQKNSWIAKTRNEKETLGKLLNQALQKSPPAELSQFMRTADAERILCPVRLGDARDPADGLVGFFREQEPAEGPFYAAWGLDFGNGKYETLKPEQDLMLDAANPLRLTLLMDPQARVHATSGVLPRVFFSLPAAEASGARQAREVFFQAAPVLGTTPTPQIPKPSDDYGQWSWACRPPVTGARQTPLSERPWSEDPDLVDASDRANIEAGVPTITEGWLKLKIAPVRINDLWVKEGSVHPRSNTSIMLAWTLQGAERVQLFRLKGNDKEPVRDAWTEAPLGTEYRVTVVRDTTYELVAGDRAGYEDRRQITIRVAD